MKSFNSAILLYLVIFSLAGCGKSNIDLVSGVGQLIDNGVKLYPSEYQGAYVSQGEVSGEICHRDTRTNIIFTIEVKNNLMENAKAKEMDAVMNVKCSINKEVDWARNCWAVATCKGEGIKIE